MRAFLSPHQLLSAPELYRAALHRDPAMAQASWRSWLAGFDAEALTFHDHKSIGIAVARHGPDAPGVVTNVARQSRLRAHASDQLLRDVLTLFPDIRFLALGETRGRLHPEMDPIDVMDTVELAVPIARFDDVVTGVSKLSLTPVRAPRRAPLRGARIAVCRVASSPLQMRLIGLDRCFDPQGAVASFPGLFVATPDAHSRFVTGRMASLLSRRDQVFFDIYQSRTAGQPIALSRLSGRARRQAEDILGTDDL